MNIKKEQNGLPSIFQIWLKIYLYKIALNIKKYEC